MNGFTSPPAATRGRRLYALATGGLLLALSACAEKAPQDTMEPAGPVSRKILHLSEPVFLIAGVFLVLIPALVLYSVLKFRDRPGSPEPQQVHGNTKLEVGWTLIPALILFSIAIPTIKTIFDLSKKPANALQVTVIGHQFWWEYRYDDLGITTANELSIVAGQPVELTLESIDVIHSYWIPPLAGKTDVIPGRQNHMSFEADKPGTFLGQCTEFCGLSHANMRARAVAYTQADFDTWVARQKSAAVTPPAGTEAADGLALFNGKGCAGCHTVAGVSQGKVGPDLTHLQSRATFAGSIFALNEDNLRTWLENPPAVKPGSVMPDLGLTEDEITQLIAYLETLQ
ncbi:MAG: cytochrome c oxidase subunit [Actinomycetota bacterium]|nr:cytochrome c oxidase subunit [Actinomycetota bacterium]